MSGRHVLAVLLLPLVLVAACGRAPVTPPAAPPAFDISVLRQSLDSSSLPVSSSEGTAGLVFGRLAQYQPLEVGRRPMHVYWFPSSSDASFAASRVRSDGRVERAEGASTRVEWNGEPHFFMRGSLLAVYVSQSTTLTPDDTRVLRVLKEQMGPPLVGAERTRPRTLLSTAANGVGSSFFASRWVFLALAAVCSAVVVALVVMVIVLWVRARRWYMTLRAAGLTYRVSPSDAWSPETIEAVFLAYNPARVRSRADHARPYDAASRTVFEGLPQHEPGQRETFDELFDRAWGSVPKNKAPRQNRVRRVASRLWEMHAAAFERWDSDD